MGSDERMRGSQLRILKSIKDTQLNVSVILMEQRFSVGQLVGLSPGGILMFERSSSDPASLAINGQTFAKGEVVQQGEHYGLKIDEILTH